MCYGNVPGTDAATKDHLSKLQGCHMHHNLPLVGDVNPKKSIRQMNGESEVAEQIHEIDGQLGNRF